MEERVREKKSMFTVKNVMRGLALFCIVCVFCPSFMVSCSGQNMNVSVMTAVRGVSVYGEKVVDAYPIMLICLLLPVAVLIALIVRSVENQKATIIALSCSGADLVIWIIFKTAVKKLAEENYCAFKITGWYVLNMAALVVLIAAAGLVLVGKLQMDHDLAETASSEETKRTLNQMSSVMSQVSSTVTKMAGDAAANIGNHKTKEQAIGYCSKCGSPISYGAKFCTSCGTPVPESMIAEAEAARQAAEKASEKVAEKTAETEVGSGENSMIVDEGNVK